MIIFLDEEDYINIFLCIIFQLKDEGKKAKRTPSFNIRRRTRSFKDKYRLPENLPPAELETTVERKQELQAGGKKATIRSWKNLYSVLYGQLLCFFKDKEGKDTLSILNKAKVKWKLI